VFKRLITDEQTNGRTDRQLEYTMSLASLDCGQSRLVGDIKIVHSATTINLMTVNDKTFTMQCN